MIIRRLNRGIAIIPRSWMALLILLGTGSASAAQEPSERALPDVQERIQRVEDYQLGAAEDLAFPDAPDRSTMSEETSAAYQDALRAYFSYRKRGYEHRSTVFAWQSLSTQIIFFVVLVLVFAGIYFAAMQFHAGMRRRGVSNHIPSQTDETEISLSLREFKVRSPVLGVIILALSLAFFYLYLVHVYPIRDVF